MNKIHLGTTERIIGKLVLATQAAGPSRGLPWVRQGGGLSGSVRLKPHG